MAEQKLPSATFSSLSEIAQAKVELSQVISEDEERVATLWNELFHQSELKSTDTPAERMIKVMNTGAGLIDGLLLGWKLYRKFQNVQLPFIGKKRRRG